MAVTSEREPAEAAASILERGGNAIDAAAAAQFMLNVVEPQSSGLGGGGFMMIYIAGTGETIVVDSRETAPAAAGPRMFLDASGQPATYALASTSGYSVGVPGTLRGIEVALARWGTMSLADTLGPAIEAAQQGIRLNARLAKFTSHDRLRNECDSDPRNSPYATARAVFRPDDDPASCGQPLSTGDVLVQPDLARTFRSIAEGGAAAFYNCDHPAGIARAIIAAQWATRGANTAGSGLMTCDDLASYGAVLRSPVQGEYRGYLVRSAPPPSSGGLAVLEILRMLERFPIGAADRGFAFGAPATLNVMLEAMRLAFADRALWMGDTDQVPDVSVGRLTDDTYLRLRGMSCPDFVPDDAFYCISAGERLPDVRAGDPRPFRRDGMGVLSSTRLAPSSRQQDEGMNTTHFTIVDRVGNIVSYTTSIEAPWGSGLMVPGFGFMLNNELTDFNFVPRRRGAPQDADYDPGANDVGPHKRPRSSMAPTILFAHDQDGVRPVAAYGSPGGASIVNTVLNVTLNLVDHRLPLSEAIARPRFSLTQPDGEAITSIEPGFDAGVLEGLRGLGYRFAEQATVIGAVQAIVIDPATGALFGEGDPRRNGTAIGLPGSHRAGSQ